MKNFIHYYVISFESKKNNINNLFSYLSDDEIAKANLFSFQHLRENFIICRGSLRECLSKYLFVSPQHIKFSYTPYDKPEIDFPKTEKLISFNVSHSKDFFVIAISSAVTVGVDIEYCDQNMNVLEIAPEVFTQNEIAKLSTTAENQHIFEFFKIWTIKEAFIKALGYGFSFDPKGIEIQEDTNTFITIPSTQNKLPIGIEPWYFSQIFLHKKYSLAFVTQIQNITFKNFTTIPKDNMIY